MKFSLGEIFANLTKAAEDFGGSYTPVCLAATAAGYQPTTLDAMMDAALDAIDEHGSEYRVECGDGFEEDDYPEFLYMHPGLVFWWARRTKKEIA